MKPTTAPLSKKEVKKSKQPESPANLLQKVAVKDPVLPVVAKKKPSNLLLILLIVLILGSVGLVVGLSRMQTPKGHKDALTNLPTPKPLFLMVDNPKLGLSAIDGEVLIKGSTLPNTTVVIYSDLDETSVDSDEQGNFQDTVVVGEAGGLVKITAYGDNDQEQSLIFDVFDQDLDVLGQTTKTNQGKNEDSPGNAKKNDPVTVQETVRNEVQDNKPEKVRPVVRFEDLIATSSTKINKPQAEFKIKPPKPQAIVDFLNDLTEVKKAEKLGTIRMLTLLAQEGTVSAQLRQTGRIKKMLATEATSGAQLKRHAVSGVIISLSDGVITLAHQIQRERVTTVYYNSSTIITGKDSTVSASLKVGLRIAAVGVPSGDGLLAARIHMIPGKAVGLFEKNPVSTVSAGLKPSPVATGSAIPSFSPSPIATTSAGFEP